MAYAIGTATDHVDLFNKIRDFLTTNTDLVNAGQNWTQELGSTGTLTSSDQITLRGPGLAGTDNIYCGMDLTESVADDRFNLRIWGHAAFSSTIGPHDQSLQSRDVYVFLWNQPIDYWIIANGRRWMLAAKISTVYTSAYVGFFLPYATPSEYPYPMYVAGISAADRRWSSQDERDRFFVSPGYATADVYYPDNNWRMVANQYNDYDDRILGAYGSAYTYPFIGDDGWGGPSSDTMIYNTSKCFDGSYVMRDVILCSNDPYASYLGVLDGAYWVPGRENSSENIITKDTVDYVVFQNLFRNGFRDYMALRLS